MSLLTGSATLHSYSHFKLLAIDCWLKCRHMAVAYLVLINGLLIFKTVYGMSGHITDLFQINSFTGLAWSDLANGPWFMLGIFLVLNSAGLFFRARLAWAVSIILVVITLFFTLHFYPNQTININFCIVSLFALFIFGKDFNRSSATAGGIFSAISFTVLLFYSTYGALYFGDGFKPQIHNLMSSFYFSIVTMTTVGYGDIIPVSESARLFTTSVIIAGITVFATSVTTVFGPVIRGGLNKLVKGNQYQMKRKDHFIVCGTSILAINTINQLKQRNQNITIITSKTEDEFNQIAQRLPKELDVLYGDPTDNNTLKSAGVNYCQALLALTNRDADNAFIVLSAKEFSPSIKTVLAVNDSANINKVKQVKPDVVLSPQLFGSEILASVLSGESLDNNKISEILFNSGMGLFDKQETD